jgi:D-amino-acid dehydrogenase
MPEHVSILGAGILGAATALEVLADGHTVTIVEPAEPGGEQAASYGNGAWLSPASVVPVSMPGLWKKVPGYLMDRTGPLTMRATSLPGLAPWLLRFMRAGATVPRVEATARALAALLRAAPERHRTLAARAGVAELIRQDGLLYPFPDRTAFEAEALAWRLRRDNGIVWQELEGDALRARAPDLDARYRFGLYVPAGGHCTDPGAYVAALVRAAQAAGARLHRARAQGFVLRDGRLASVRTDAGEIACTRAVIAAGIRSAPLARAAGDVVPLAAERGYHVVLADTGLALPVPMMPADSKMAITMTRGGLRLAGQVELAATDAAPDWRRADILLAHARRMYPALAARTDLRPSATWMGHRPSTPDGLPVLGPASGCADVLHAFGHGHVGLAAAATSARLIADLVSGKPPAIDPAPYRASRF